MLILSRKQGMSVTIKTPAGPVEVTFLALHGPKGEEVRLGFNAPKSINIVRSELLDRYPDQQEKEDETKRER